MSTEALLRFRYSLRFRWHTVCVSFVRVLEPRLVPRLPKGDVRLRCAVRYALLYADVDEVVMPGENVVWVA